MGNLLNKTRLFVKGTIEELHKCTWPTREELYQSTIIVIVAIAVLSIYVVGIDFVAQKLITLLTTAL